MKRLIVIVSAIAILGVTGWAGTKSSIDVRVDTPVSAVQSGEQKRVFSIENMTCAACPITVRKAMERVEGVKSVVVDFDLKTATAVFDPNTTTAEDIARASENVGYPATLVEG